ncbi:MAG: WG repeat-containing protein, partial [Alistipes sp.]|nr:WG repeat-containing protein [Alistipes sp.]
GVALNGCGFIDKTGKEVIPLKYDDASSFSGGKAKVMTKNIFGIEKEFYIDKNGNIVK